MQDFEPTKTMKNLYVLSFLFLLAACNGKPTDQKTSDTASLADAATPADTTAATPQPNNSTDEELEKLTKQTFADSGQFVSASAEVMRHLQTADGTFLNITTGVFNLRGNYLIPAGNGETAHYANFDGFQKGKNIFFKGYNPESTYQPLYHFKGTLNTDSGSIVGSWKITNKDGSATEPVKFLPINFQPNPKLNYRLFAVEIDHRLYVNKIQVVDEANTPLQVLDGFIARPILASLYVEDLNFDGWFDLRLTKNSGAYTNGEDVDLFWLYNPDTKKYEPATELNKLNLDYSHIDEKTQILILSNRSNNKSNFFGYKFNGLTPYQVKSPF